jgi:BASS family bile acid:Na+ symporter
MLGYGVSKAVGAGEARSRTISIETGMQNSALAVVLAQHFPNPALSSLPGALSATVHSVIGSILAALWRNRPAPVDD